ncbi:MAG: PBP1A family penicillin-binding protein [Acidobacteriota bacterium]
MNRRFLYILLALHGMAFAAGIVVGLILSRDLPDIGTLDPQALPQMTRLLNRNGEELKSFAEQQRISVPFSKIAPAYRDALLATEDPRFRLHIGVDPQAILRAALANTRNLRFSQGGSTITQQLARFYFLHQRKDLTRKVQEAYLALKLEKTYSKEEILTLYCNGIYLGHGQYGVEAAARFFFDKTAAQLTLPEAAMLAGLTQSPESLSPLRHPERALQRRNHVLERMVVEGFLDRTAAETAKQAPLGLATKRPVREFAPYFIEEVRRGLLERFGEDGLYRGGLTVHTTLDPKAQRAAERAIRAGLDDYGRRHKQIPNPRALPPGKSAADYVDPTWGETFSDGDVVDAVVLESSASAATLRLGDQTLQFGAKEIAWTGRLDLGRLLPPNTLVPLILTKVTSWGRVLEARLGSEPSADAALIAIDVRTGEVLALVGGKNFEKSEFDRAMQAQRQAGSAFKPVVAAAALELGLSPETLLWDVPTVFTSPGFPEPYQPENYDRQYDGLVTLRHTIEQSRNIPTIRLLDAIGYTPAIEVAHRLGIGGELRPYPSLALGAFEVRLVELAKAYGCFANGGLLVEPRMIRTVDDTSAGQVLYSTAPTSRVAIRPEVAAQVTSILQGVVQRGTARNALSLGRPLAGKTGTTDDYTDAWFVGYTPSIVAAVWIGHDQRKPLGRGESGSVAALPIWIDFMKDALREVAPQPFETPAELVQTTFDRRTGKRAVAESGCLETVEELLSPDAPEASACSPRDHMRTDLPYPLQFYPIERDGSLRIPPDDVLRYVARGPAQFRVIGQGQSIQFNFGGKSGIQRLAWNAADWQHYLQSTLPVTPEEGERRGADGWIPLEVAVNSTGSPTTIQVPIDP